MRVLYVGRSGRIPDWRGKHSTQTQEHQPQINWEIEVSKLHFWNQIYNRYKYLVAVLSRVRYFS